MIDNADNESRAKRARLSRERNSAFRFVAEAVLLRAVSFWLRKTQDAAAINQSTKAPRRPRQAEILWIRAERLRTTRYLNNLPLQAEDHSS